MKTQNPTEVIWRDLYFDQNETEINFGKLLVCDQLMIKYATQISDIFSISLLLLFQLLFA